VERIILSPFCAFPWSFHLTSNLVLILSAIGFKSLGKCLNNVDAHKSLRNATRRPRAPPPRPLRRDEPRHGEHDAVAPSLVAYYVPQSLPYGPRAAPTALRPIQYSRITGTAPMPAAISGPMQKTVDYMAHI
jgi:hypothetical protein